MGFTFPFYGLSFTNDFPFDRRFAFTLYYFLPL
jgi:hypothetical protein